MTTQTCTKGAITLITVIFFPLLLMKNNNCRWVLQFS